MEKTMNKRVNKLAATLESVQTTLQITLSQDIVKLVEDAINLGYDARVYGHDRPNFQQWLVKQAESDD